VIEVGPQPVRKYPPLWRASAFGRGSLESIPNRLICARRALRLRPHCEYRPEAAE
jgi:hypothetical protein